MYHHGYRTATCPFFTKFQAWTNFVHLSNPGAKKPSLDTILRGFFWKQWGRDFAVHLINIETNQYSRDKISLVMSEQCSVLLLLLLLLHLFSLYKVSFEKHPGEHFKAQKINFKKTCRDWFDLFSNFLGYANPWSILGHRNNSLHPPFPLRTFSLP